MGRIIERRIQQSGTPVRRAHCPSSRGCARIWCAAVLVLTIGPASAGCLVVTMQPVFDESAIVFDEALLGTWQSEDDETRVTIARDEWRSYRIEYAHPIEAGVLTGYLSSIGGALYMDLMLARGRDFGTFVVPMHAAVRVTIANDRLELTPLAYDAFLDTARVKGVPGLAFVLDQKQNVVVSTSTAGLRRWLGSQGSASRWLGPTTAFRRVPPPAALEYSPAMPHN